MRKHVLRNLRYKLFKALTKEPQAVELRVIGREGEGFRLGGEINNNMILLSAVFKKQKDAVEYGERMFHTKAKKMLALPSSK